MRNSAVVINNNLIPNERAQLLRKGIPGNWVHLCWLLIKECKCFSRYFCRSKTSSWYGTKIS